MLSHPLRIVALVSRYLTNQLIRGRPLLRWNHTFALHMITSEEIIGYYPQFPVAIPDPRVRHLPVTTPFAAVPPCGVLARLACLIHAANVHSEPGSNPSICIVCRTRFRARPDPGRNLNGGLNSLARTHKTTKSLSLCFRLGKF